VCAAPQLRHRLTFCVKPDLYVRREGTNNHSELSGRVTQSAKPWEGPGHEGVKQDARPTGGQTASAAERALLWPPRECATGGGAVLAELRGLAWPTCSIEAAGRRGGGRSIMDRGGIEMRLFVCHEQRMLRALHGRWPYRRSHCRHDLHWLVRIRGEGWRCSAGRTHSLAGLKGCSRRGPGG
jgi:hypothetical protein